MSGLLTRQQLMMIEASAPVAATTVSLLHFDGADGSTSFVDSAGLAWTRRGSAVISTAQSKFGGSSMRTYSGVANGIICNPATAHDFGASDFTIEFFIYPLASPSASQWWGPCGKSVPDQNVSAWRLWWNGSAGLSIEMTTAAGLSVISLNPAGLTVNEWQHVSVCRRGSRVFSSINGVVTDVAGITGSLVNESTMQLYCGSYNSHQNSSINAYIDEFRITKGAALYTSNFTPPTVPFQIS